MTEKGHTTMLLSREELEVLEACVLICLDNNSLDADTAKDAKAVLEEIRLFLDRDAPGVAESVGDEIKAEYAAGDGEAGGAGR